MIGIPIVTGCVMVGMACAGALGARTSEAPAVSLPASPPPAPEPPKDPIAAVDEQADHARAQKDENAALDSYIVARTLLDLAERDGASPKDVKPRRAAIDKAIKRLDCSVMGEVRAGAVRDYVIGVLSRAGISANVRVSGTCNTTMTIEWPGWSDVTVAQIEEVLDPVLISREFKVLRLKSWDQMWTHTY